MSYKNEQSLLFFKEVFNFVLLLYITNTIENNDNWLSIVVQNKCMTYFFVKHQVNDLNLIFDEVFEFLLHKLSNIFQVLISKNNWQFLNWWFHSELSQLFYLNVRQPKTTCSNVIISVDNLWNLSAFIPKVTNRLKRYNTIFKFPSDFS